jgi:hypothetical protein
MPPFAVRAPEGRPTRRRLQSLREVFAAKLRIETTKGLQFSDLVKYADDPVGFAHDLIGCETWDKQDLMLEAIRDHDRVSVRASQKASKDHSAAIIALWWLCTRTGARVIFTAPSWKQTQQVLYRQIKQHIGAIRKRFPGLLDGLRVAELCDTGIQTQDYTDLRSINGFVSQDDGNLQGISAGTGKLLVIIDEASHVRSDVYLALDSNLAAGGKMFVISNPLRSSGWFADTHHKNREFWHCIHISALMNPNYIQRRTVISGLASYDYVERKRKEWGENSAQFQTRILGEFNIKEEGRIFPHERVTRSIELREHASTEGKLQFGLDPAGPGRDETALCGVRGKRMLYLEVERHLEPEQIVQWVARVVNEMSEPDEKPEVRVDSEGQIGARVLGMLLNEQKAGRFIVVNIRSNEAAQDKLTYGSIRDEIAAHAEKWLKDGGGIIDDQKLTEELAIMEWFTDIKGRNRLISKKEIAKIIYRSPDRFDALCLAVYSTTVGNSREMLQRQLEQRAAEQSQRTGRSPDRAWREKEKSQGSRRALYGR